MEFMFFALLTIILVVWGLRWLRRSRRATLTLVRAGDVYVQAGDNLPPRHVQIARGLVAIVIMLVVLLIIGAVRSASAEERRPSPLPVPSTGGVCPSGYSPSPTSGYCVPHLNTRSNAVPKQGYAPCPSGWHESMQSFCVQERR
jgi:hypothetical protein